MQTKLTCVGRGESISQKTYSTGYSLFRIKKAGL